MLTIRKSNERGQANHGWLKSFHTFSFASYYDPKHMHFDNLRVINEDFIAGGTGFTKHPHDNMEIITYVISGALAHQDSMGNSSVISADEVQIMSAGTGVFHSEFNHEKHHETHLLQIWILPKIKQITPRYDQKSFADIDGLQLVVSGSGRDGSLAINQDAEIFLGKFNQEKGFDFEINQTQKIWLQVVEGKVLVNDVTLENGDAAAITDEKIIRLKAKKNSRFLLFVL